jgi:superfamily II DNA or RNA helicase
VADPTSLAAFGDLAFREQFRPYQATILRDAPAHLADGRIHVVAAPGSGKTVLGLELIRMVYQPALILSPTLVVSQQWAQRLAEMFLPPGVELTPYVSHQLDQPALITSITYQALHSASRSSDLASLLNARGISTICLDEAHHLRREWHQCLETVISQLGSAVRIIALTATPPYDADATEWDRYIRLCGPVDEEIPVPRLVADGTLCPHQDYIYFTTPTRDDAAVIAEHQANVTAFLFELASGGLVAAAIAAAAAVAAQVSAWEQSSSETSGPDPYNPETSSPEPSSQAADYLFERADDLLALIALARWARIEVPDILLAVLAAGPARTRLNLTMAESAASVVAEGAALFGPLADQVVALARRHRVFFKGRFELARSSEIEHTLTNSLGKLTAAGRIAAAELENLGQDLRLVVLTDYIRADHLPIVGTDVVNPTNDGPDQPGDRIVQNEARPITAIGAVPIFETLRRHLPPGTPIGLLTGSLVLWPERQVDALMELARQAGETVRRSPLGTTGYTRLDFGGSNRTKVALVTEAFQRGDVVALVGTTALLGEGWDSPSVNCLIMASFVGSFMLSNQMRGRAIRTFRAQPDKTANIWHLVALGPADSPSSSAGLGQVDTAPGLPLAALPDDGDPRIRSADFRTLARRFRGFFGPAYSSPEIRTGIGRVDTIRPPLTRPAVHLLNSDTLRRAAGRAAMAQAWRDGLAGGPAEVRDVAALRADRLRPGSVIWFDVLSALVASLVAGSLAWLVSDVILPALRASGGDRPLGVALAIGVALIVLWGRFGLRAIRRVNRGASTERTLLALAKAVWWTMLETAAITSDGTSVAVVRDGRGWFECSLAGGTPREKAAFADAVAELVAPISNPRYVLVRRRWRWRWIGRRPEASPRPSGRPRSGLTSPNAADGPRPAPRSVVSRPGPGWLLEDSFACPGFVSTAATAAIFERHVRHYLDRFDVRYTRNPAGRMLLVACRRQAYANRSVRTIERFRRLMEAIRPRQTL